MIPGYRATTRRRDWTRVLNGPDLGLGRADRTGFVNTVVLVSYCQEICTFNQELQ